MTTAYTPASAVSDAFNVGFVLTSGNVSNIYGFITGVIGSVVPTTIGGHSIIILGSIEQAFPLPNQFTIVLAGVAAQDLFDSITLLGTTLLTADASYLSAGSTQWVWADTVLHGVTGVVPITLV